MDLEKIVVVANNGMNTQENKYLIVSKGNGYIVSKSVKKVGSPKETGHQNKKGYTYIRNASNQIVFKYKSRINEITLIYKNKNETKSKKIIKEKVIGVKNITKKLHQKPKFIEYLESCKEKS